MRCPRILYVRLPSDCNITRRRCGMELKGLTFVVADKLTGKLPDEIFHDAHFL